MAGTPTEEVWLETSDRLRLEAELVVPDDAWAGSLLCHPHPTQGGSMRSMVTGHQFRMLPHHGVACLRFNFRGVERSDGSHGGGRPERLDVLAGLGALFEVIEGLPLVLAGWSFGADTSLSVVDERIDGWCATAPPLRVFPPDELIAGPDPRPKLLVVPENDQFRPPERLDEIIAGWAATEVRMSPGTDHFLVGRLDDAVDGVTSLARALAEPHARDY
ncbi:MAG TPA: hypothetical protein VGA13_09175 [Acidimicrobiales bacterium]|jgi:alpha/beta superfamily hydrolase